MTLAILFKGNLGRVTLTRVALRLRRPDLLVIPTDQPLEPGLVDVLVAARDAVNRG